MSTTAGSRVAASLLLAAAWALTSSAELACPAGTRQRMESGDGGNKQWCEKPDGTQHGPSVRWDAEGQRRFEANFREGELHGPFRSWYENGQLRFEEQYQDGLRDGFAVAYHANGAKQAEGHFVDGAYDGTWTAWDPEGNIVKVAEYAKGEQRSERVFPQE